MGLFFILASYSYAYDDGDFQIWNTDIEEFKMGKDSKIVLEEEFRWGDNAHEFYYHHYDGGFSYNFKKWLNGGMGYRHIYELKKGKFMVENEPYLTAKLLWDWEDFSLENRHRIEYRHFNYQKDSVRYRNKLTVRLPWGIRKAQPYFSEEIFISFYKLNDNELNQNRFSLGLNMELTKRIKLETYYMLQSNKNSGKWIDANVLGLNLKTVF